MSWKKPKNRKRISIWAAKQKAIECVRNRKVAFEPHFQLERRYRGITLDDIIAGVLDPNARMDPDPEKNKPRPHRGCSSYTMRTYLEGEPKSYLSYMMKGYRNMSARKKQQKGREAFPDYDKQLERELQAWDSAGEPIRRRLAEGERIEVSELGIDGLYVTGTELEVLESPSGEKSLIIPNPAALLRAAFQVVTLRIDKVLTAQEFRFLRKHMKLTQEELAERLSIDKATINRMEKAKMEIQKTTSDALRLQCLFFLLNDLPPEVRHEKRGAFHAIQERLSEFVEGAGKFGKDAKVELVAAEA